MGLVRHILALDVPGLQAVSAEGSAKLLLSGMLYDAGVSGGCPSATRLALMIAIRITKAPATTRLALLVE